MLQIAQVKLTLIIRLEDVNHNALLTQTHTVIIPLGHALVIALLNLTRGQTTHQELVFLYVLIILITTLIIIQEDANKTARKEHLQILFLEDVYRHALQDITVEMLHIDV